MTTDIVNTTPVITLDLAKADRKQLRFLAKERDKDRVIGLLKGSAGGVKDISIKFLEVMKEDEVTRLFVLSALILFLIKSKVLSDLEGAALQSLVLVGTAADFIIPWN